MSAINASFGFVNPDLRIKGARGLRIVDTSVFFVSYFVIVLRHMSLSY